MSRDITMKIVLLLLLGSCLLLPATASATTVKAVYIGGPQTSYAIDANGDVWVWGTFQGQKYVHPTRVPFIGHVASIAPGMGGDAIALKDDGTVWAWGSLPSSLAGHYPGENSTLPVQINISDVKSVASTGNTVYMIKTDGSLWMCGDELCLELEDITHTEYSLEPIRLPAGNVSEVVPTQSFVCVKKEDGSWWGWGENRNYQLNDGTSVNSESPVQMQLTNLTSITAQSTCFGINNDYVSRSSIVALNDLGQVYGWGDNTYSVSGDPVFPRYSNAQEGAGYVVSTPHPVPGMDNIREIGSGKSYNVALKNDGTVWAWGSNPEAYDGRSSLDSNKPIQLAGFTGITSIIAGDQHLLAIKKDGTVWAWGSNRNGELGNGEISDFGGKSHAVQVTDLYVELPTETDAARSSPTSAPVPGFGFGTIALLGCLLITAGLLSGFTRRKDK